MTNKLKCKECKAPVRHPGCHATCSYYIEWNEQHQKDLENERKNKWMENLAKPAKSGRRRK